MYKWMNSFKKHFVIFMVWWLMSFVMSGISYGQDHLTDAGLIAYKQGNYKQALRFLSEAVKLNPDNTRAVYFFANTLVKTHNVKHACKYYSRVVDLEPGSQLADYSREALDDINSYKSKIRIPYNSLLLKGTDLYTSENSYIQDVIGDNPVIHWDKTTMPLKVFVRKSYYPVHKDIAMDAFDEWENKSFQLVAFEPAHTEKEAHIIVHWIRKYQNNPNWDFYGYALSEVQHNELLKYNIYIEEADARGNVLLPEKIKIAAMHQIGHALGIQGHSTNPEDVMYINPDAIVLTRRDVATLNLLYDFNPDISNFEEATRIHQEVEIPQESPSEE